MIWLGVTTIKMSLLVAIGLIAAAVARRRSAALRHWLMAAALASAAMVPLLTLVGPTWTLPVPRGVRATPTPHVTTTVDAVARDPASTNSPEPSGPRPTAIERATPWAFLLWLGGAGMNLLLLLVSMHRLRRAVAKMPALSCATWSEGLHRVAQMLGIRRQVRLLTSDRGALIVTWGRTSPNVVLPRGAEHWTPERVHVVLMHELAHIARGDWLVQIGAEALRSVFWFNPLLWLACLRLRHESERACDDVVLAAGVHGDAYATQLLELARLFGADGRSWFPTPAMTGRSSGLERRISAMFDTRLRRTPLTRTTRSAFLAGFAAIALPVAAFAQASFGSLAGTVTDQTDRVLPNVTVTVVDEQRNVSHVVHTDRDGHFQLVGLAPGAYQVQTWMPGFQPASTTVAVNGDATERNLALEIGNLQETVTVTSATGPAHVTSGIPARPIPPCPSASPIGGDIRAPRKLRDARPAYSGVDGIVTLKAVIAPDGSVSDVHVVKSDRPELEAPAIDAVSQWQFDSTLLNCVPVAVTMNVTMAFRQQ